MWVCVCVCCFYMKNSIIMPFSSDKEYLKCAWNSVYTLLYIIQLLHHNLICCELLIVLFYRSIIYLTLCRPSQFLCVYFSNDFTYLFCLLRVRVWVCVWVCACIMFCLLWLTDLNGRITEELNITFTNCVSTIFPDRSKIWPSDDINDSPVSMFCTKPLCLSSC